MGRTVVVHMQSRPNVGLHVHRTYMELNRKNDSVDGIIATLDTIENRASKKTSIKVSKCNWKSKIIHHILGSIAYTLFPRKMSIDQAGNNRVMLPSVIGHFNKTLGAGGKLSTEQVKICQFEWNFNRNLNQIRNIIRKELLLYGPTTLALPLTEEFLHYDSGKSKKI